MSLMDAYTSRHCLRKTQRGVLRCLRANFEDSAFSRDYDETLLDEYTKLHRRIVEVVRNVPLTEISTRVNGTSMLQAIAERERLVALRDVLSRNSRDARSSMPHPEHRTQYEPQKVATDFQTRASAANELLYLHNIRMENAASDSKLLSIPAPIEHYEPAAINLSRAMMLHSGLRICQATRVSYLYGSLVRQNDEDPLVEPLETMNEFEAQSFVYRDLTEAINATCAITETELGLLASVLLERDLLRRVMSDIHRLPPNDLLRPVIKSTSLRLSELNRVIRGARKNTLLLIRPDSLSILGPLIREAQQASPYGSFSSHLEQDED